MKARLTRTGQLLFFLLFFEFSSYSTADIVRGKILQNSTIENGSPSTAVHPMHLEDLWLLAVGEDRDLVEGVEIFIETPPTAQTYQGIYGFYLYGNISPPPSLASPQPALQSYRATQLYFKPFVNERKLYVRIPLESKTVFPPSPDTVVLDKPVQTELFPLLFTFLPIMKGIPEAALQAQFRIQVRPLFKNLGKVRFSVKAPTGPVPLEKVRVFMDGQPLQLKDESIHLPPGLKNFRVEIDGFPPFQTTVAIEKGKVIPVEAIFIKTDVTVHINAPAGTHVFIDGTPASINEGELSLDPGEHTFSFRLGDYQVSKRIYLEQGKSYGVSLFLDILINED
ncbi:MAG: hypothetical protein Kow009_12790 [Spirochaetales bacterium]